MGYLVPGDLDACLRVLETRIRKYHPGCAFYFGGVEEANRPASPPFVRWAVVDAEAQQGTVDRQPKGRFQAVDDLVVMQARCAGALLSGLLGPDPRRQQLAASVQVMLAVSLAVHGEHQGYVDDRGWRPVYPTAPTDAYVPIDYTFAIRAPRLTPDVDSVLAESAPGELELT